MPESVQRLVTETISPPKQPIRTSLTVPLPDEEWCKKIQELVDNLRGTSRDGVVPHTKIAALVRVHISTSALETYYSKLAELFK